MRKLSIQEAEAGQRLDKFLKKYMREAPDSFLYKMLRKKNITLNGRKAAGKELLAPGDEIALFLADETIDSFRAKDNRDMMKGHALDIQGRNIPQPDILYEDAHVLAVNKPAGILSQKASAQDISMNEMILHYLVQTGELTPQKRRAFCPSVCNRLDRNTSGILLAGKTLAGLQGLSRILKDRSLVKEYLCIVQGDISAPLRLDGYVHKDRASNKVTVAREETAGAARIRTDCTPLAHTEEASLLAVHLITGRTHQIRAHLADIGHPLLGDWKYGGAANGRRWKERYGLISQLLHSYRLVFPVMDGELRHLSGKRLLAPVPAEFAAVAAGLFGTDVLPKLSGR